MTGEVRQREPAYRNRKLLDLAHEAPCCLLLGLDGCGNDSSVPCHDDRLSSGRGEGYKSDDCLAVSGCPVCHAAFTRKNLGREGYAEVWGRAMARYLVWLWSQGKVKVA